MKKAEAAVSTFRLCKTYTVDELKIEVLRDVELDVGIGEFATIGGPSGSGKTTLLNIIGGLDKSTSGEITVFGNDLSGKNEDFLADFRCTNVGFVFQAYNLVSTLTVAENIAFPMEWTRKTESYIQKRADELLQLVGLQHRAEHFPFQLSGGEQQRVAFARALANDPPLLLVDEPTGNLDAKTSLNVIQILQRLKTEGKTVIVATHDERIFKLADQSFSLEDGKLVNFR